MGTTEFLDSTINAFGASDSNSLLIILFIPTKDKDGNDLGDAEMWLNAAIKLLSKQFGGATVMAPAQGAWFNGESGEIIQETVHLVNSYAKPDVHSNCFQQLSDFLHRMGRETHQGEIGVVVDSVFHRITSFRK